MCASEYVCVCVHECVRMFVSMYASVQAFNSEYAFTIGILFLPTCPQTIHSEGIE